jgi:phage/plasmid primase-like uncharacterized protein
MRANGARLLEGLADAGKQADAYDVAHISNERADAADRQIADARSMPIEDVLSARNVRLKKSGAELVGPCPICGGTDRFAINVRKQVFYCRHCAKGGDAIELVKFLDRCNFLQAVEGITGQPRCGSLKPRRAPRPFEPAQFLPNDEAYHRRALSIWREATDLRGTHGEIYLRRDRGLDCSENFSGFLRWHEPSGALIGLFRDIETDELRAITRIFLDPEGHKITRKFLGPVGGCGIKIDPDENVTMGIVVCEGLETGLAAKQLGYSPIWALGSSGAIRRLQVIRGIEGLTILAEAGETSRRDAQQCFERWRRTGREVKVRKSTVGSDINDAIKGAR